MEITITREINGNAHTITLTDAEILHIFNVCQHQNDLEEIRFGIDAIAQYDDEDGLLADVTDEEVEDMAEEFRESIDWGGVNDEICGRRDDIIRQFMDDKRQEREWEGGDN